MYSQPPALFDFGSNFLGNASLLFCILISMKV